MGKISIAIDEPASSGESTVAKILAKQLSYVYCDTGTMYRAITCLTLQGQTDIQAEEPLVALCVGHAISFQRAENGRCVFIDGHEVTEAIRQPDVTNTVSAVSKHARAREEMVALQQKIGRAGGVIMSGRDVGTTVLPKAEVKIFLVVSVEERIERRFKENREKRIETGFEALRAEIERRDYLGSTREISPPAQASNVMEIDTISLTTEEVVAAVQNMIKQKDFELF